MKTTSRVGSLLAVGLFSTVIGMSLNSTEAARNSRRETIPKVLTFTKDVAPILFRNCVRCHRPGEIGPMSLTTYGEVRPWARSIREEVISREMPPWHADSAPGEFANDRSLTQEEIRTIVDWVDQGSREGDPKQLPPLPEVDGGWRIGEPDIVFSMPEDYAISAEGPDEYINFRIPTHFSRDMWVQAIELQPGNRRIVHHLACIVEERESIGNKPVPPEYEKDHIFRVVNNLQRVKPDAPVYDDGCATPAGGKGNWRDGTRKSDFTSGLGSLGYTLSVYAPGANPAIWPAGIAKRIPPGATLILQAHYSGSGKVERDRSRIGMVFAKELPDKTMHMGLLANHYFKIPPGSDNHEVTACATFQQDAHIYSMAPHMHFRGKDMTVRATYPDGRSQVLLSVPRYRFNWQTAYYFKQPVAVPKGTRLQVIAHFDNSSRNKFNPNPLQPVRWGEPTNDEMLVCFLEFTIDSQQVIKLKPAGMKPTTGKS